jgi:uncharacterized protein (DUF2235 family)
MILKNIMPKKIILFSDGTWNRPEQMDRDRLTPTNVVKMARALEPYDKDGLEQMRFYDRGVGSDGNIFDRMIAGITGIGISQNIKDIYSFLVKNYDEDDKIYCFGFSRGAYTVRSLSGFISKCGLLKKEHINKVDEAYGFYRRKGLSKDHKTMAGFRSKYCSEIKIHFMGVWDTVGALGFPTPLLRLLTRPYYRFHDEKLSPIVINAFQALAIDEQRVHFTPSLWKKEGMKDYQTVEQVWFSGVHTNIGGGYVDCGLSDHTFLWMKSKAQQCGLNFNEQFISQQIEPYSFGELRNSRKSFYKFFRKYIRPMMAEENANESVHISALDRINEITVIYSPQNLVKVIDDGKLKLNEQVQTDTDIQLAQISNN